jgi:hypothetical protein
MKVKLKCDRVAVSPEGFGREYQPAGTIIDVPEKEAYTLLERGAAEQIEVETAALATPSRDSGRVRAKG